MEAQIIGLIKEQQAEIPTAKVCRKHGLSQGTFYKFKSKYGGMEVSDVSKMREMMLERQREGIAKAKAEGRYKGRKPTAQMKAADAIQMVASGMTKREAASCLGISERSIYRIIGQPNMAPKQHPDTKVS